MTALLMAPVAFILTDPEYLVFLAILVGGSLVYLCLYLLYGAITNKPQALGPVALVGGLVLGAVAIWAVTGLLLALAFDLWAAGMDDT